LTNVNTVNRPKEKRQPVFSKPGSDKKDVLFNKKHKLPMLYEP